MLFGREPAIWSGSTWSNRGWKPDPSRELAPRLEDRRITDRGRNRGRTNHADAWYGLQTPARFTRSMQGMDVPLDLADLLRQSIQLAEQRLQGLADQTGYRARLIRHDTD